MIAHSLAAGRAWKPGTYDLRGPYYECWTNAWNAAEAEGWQYCEGVAL